MLRWGKVKGNSQLSMTELCQVISIKENKEPGLLTIISSLNVNKQCRCPIFVLNTANKTIKLKKGSTVGKIESIQECNLIDL